MRPDETGRPGSAAGTTTTGGPARQPDHVLTGPTTTVAQLTDPAELRAAAHLIARVWNARDAVEAPMPAELMRALSHAGGYVGGAYHDGRLAGVAVAFLAEPSGGARRLHSHILGVDPAARNAGVGRALKFDQRAWALARGITEITWTYDPLVRRNAYLNLARLGATAAGYLVDFYGDMTDGINAGQGSDRIEVCWRLTGPAALRAGAGEAVVPDPDRLAAATPLLRAGLGDRPAPTGAPPRGPLLVEVPADIEAIRVRTPALGAAWRDAVRATLGAAMAAGHAVSGFTRDGRYLLEKPEER